VPGRRDDPDPQTLTDVQGVTVADRHTLVGHVVVRVDVVRRTGDLGKGQATGDVVVVDVRLEDVGDPHPGRGGDRKHAVDVALRVDHQRDPTVMGEVGAIPQGRGLDRNDGDHRGRSFRVWLVVLGLDRVRNVGREKCVDTPRRII